MHQSAFEVVMLCRQIDYLIMALGGACKGHPTAFCAVLLFTLICSAKASGYDAITISSIIAGQISEELAPGWEPAEPPDVVQTGMERDGRYLAASSVLAACTISQARCSQCDQSI